MKSNNIVLIILVALAVLSFSANIWQATTRHYKEIEQSVILQDTSYNRIVLDSIEYNIIVKDSIIYNLKEEMKDEVNKVQHMSDSDAINYFYGLVSGSKPISSLYGGTN